MNSDTQMMKGILEGCLLEMIKSGELYGYAAVEQLNQFGFDVNEATVYPLLSRLQNKGFLSVSKRPSPYGPMRKYYSITAQGSKYLWGFWEAWKRIRTVTDAILESDRNDETE